MADDNIIQYDQARELLRRKREALSNTGAAADDALKQGGALLQDQEQIQDAAGIAGVSAGGKLGRKIGGDTGQSIGEAVGGIGGSYLGGKISESTKNIGQRLQEAGERGATSRKLSQTEQALSSQLGKAIQGSRLANATLGATIGTAGDVVKEKKAAKEKIRLLEEKRQQLESQAPSAFTDKRIERINRQIEQTREKSTTKKILGFRDGDPVGIIGTILFSLLLAYAIFIDVLPFITGGTSTILDWILDITFFIAVAGAMLITTGELIGSLVGRRSAVNLLQTIAEFIPGLDVLPFHTLAVILIYADVKYGILKVYRRVNFGRKVGKKVGIKKPSLKKAA